MINILIIDDDMTLKSVCFSVNYSNKWVMILKLPTR